MTKYEIRRNVRGEPRAIEFDDNETANLFLSAPAMYEALKVALKALEETGLYTGTRIGIAKILAKAEGKGLTAEVVKVEEVK